MQNQTNNNDTITRIRSPFQLTYKDVLQFLNLSNQQFIIGMLLLISLLSFLKFLYNLGVLRWQRFEEINFDTIHLVYAQYQGRYQQIGVEFQKIRIGVSKSFKNSQMFGVYYDNPKLVEDPSKCRAVIGVVVSSKDFDNLQNFIELNDKFKHKLIQKSRMLRTSLPFVNNISFFLLPMLVYPRLNKYIAKKKMQRHLEGGIIEYYRLAEQKIDVMVPLQNHKQWFLSTFEAPIQSKKDN